MGGALVVGSLPLLGLEFKILALLIVGLVLTWVARKTRGTVRNAGASG